MSGVTVETGFDAEILDVLSDDRDRFAHLVGRAAGIGRLRLLCKDPGRRLGPVLNRCHSVIGLSATLTPSEFHRDLLGLDGEMICIELDDKRGGQALIALADLDTANLVEEF